MAATKKRSIAEAESLINAMVPDIEKPYQVPDNWFWGYLTTSFAECKDGFRKPVNATERSSRIGDVPYYGATGQVGWIDDYLTDEELVLLGEDGAPFLDLLKDKAYLISGKAWVNNHAHILKSYFGHVGNLYLLYYLNTFNYSGFVNGTTRLKLTQASMDTIPIPIAPLAEQQRIVERIESLFAKLDEAKEKAQAVVDGFEDRKAAILHKAFTGGLTDNWRAEKGIPLSSWETMTSSDLFVYVTSGSRGWSQFYSDDGAIFVRMGNLDHGTIELDFSDIQHVKLPDKAEGQRSLIQKGDILISITADVGMIGLVRDVNYEGYINQHIALARPTDKDCAEFIAWYLVSDIGYNQLKNKQRGATKVGLGLDDIRALTLSMPCKQEQEEIVKIITNLLDKEEEAKQAADQVMSTIDTMKKSILARAFRGELGTNDPNDESALELLKKVLSVEPTPQPRKKGVTLPKEFSGELKTELERKIVKLFIQRETDSLPIKDLMSVSSKPFDVLETLHDLEKRQIIKRAENNSTTYELMR